MSQRAHLEALSDFARELLGLGESTVGCGCPSPSESHLVIEAIGPDDPLCKAAHKVMSFYPHDLPVPARAYWRELRHFSEKNAFRATQSRTAKLLQWVRHEIRRVRAGIGRGSQGTGHIGINARMLETIQKNPDARGWTCTQWQRHLKCKSRSSIVETDAWKMLKMIRDELKAKRAMDRHRKPKASDRERD